MKFGALVRSVASAAGQFFGMRLTGGYAFYPVDSGPTLDFVRVGGVDAPQSLTAVFRACSLFADAAASLPWAINQPAAGGGVQAIQGTDAARALVTMSYPDRELVAFQAALLGAGYARVVLNSRGAPLELKAVPAHRMTPLCDRGGRIWYRISADASIGEPIDVTLPADQVVHLRYRATDSALQGTPPIHTCAPALAAALSLREMQSALFSNWSLPGSVLSTDQALPAPTVAELRARWDEASTGRFRGKTVLLTHGLKAGTLDLAKLVDAQAVEHARFHVAEVSRIYGVPLSLLGEPGGVSYATASEESRHFTNMSLRPFLRRVGDAYGQALLSRTERASGLVVEYDLTELLLSPGSETADYLSKLVNGGICTANEARNLLHLPDAVGGDDLRIPVNTAPPGAPGA